MRNLYFLFFLLISIKLCAQRDTIVITDSAHIAGVTSLPVRPIVSDKVTGNTFIDSIQYNGTIIHKTNQYYYLIVKDKKGTILLEGDFFDQYQCGTYKDYYESGKLKSCGLYELTKDRKGRFKSTAIGEWMYYYPNGKVQAISTY